MKAIPRNERLEGSSSFIIVREVDGGTGVVFILIQKVEKELPSIGAFLFPRFNITSRTSSRAGGGDFKKKNWVMSNPGNKKFPRIYQSSIPPNQKAQNAFSCKNISCTDSHDLNM